MVIKELGNHVLGVHVEGPELLVFLGILLLLIGSLTIFLALLKAFLISHGERNSQRAVGIIFIGPFPIIVGGRSVKLVFALLIISLVIFLVILFLSGVMAWS